MILLQSLIVHFVIGKTATLAFNWTEDDHVQFEQSLLGLADQYLPLNHASFHHHRQRRESVTCPGGNGKFGFNSYSMLTAMILGFNAVSNVIANVNNNLK